jgi:hypothetical protein
MMVEDRRTVAAGHLARKAKIKGAANHAETEVHARNVKNKALVRNVKTAHRDPIKVLPAMALHHVVSAHPRN